MSLRGRRGSEQRRDTGAATFPVTHSCVSVWLGLHVPSPPDRPRGLVRHRPRLVGGLGPGCLELRADAGPETRESRMCPSQMMGGSPRQRARSGCRPRPATGRHRPESPLPGPRAPPGCWAQDGAAGEGAPGSTGHPLLTRPSPKRTASGSPGNGLRPRGSEALPARPAEPAGTRATAKGCRAWGQEACEERLGGGSLPLTRRQVLNS